MMSATQYITRTQDLVCAVEELHDNVYITIDTEFMRRTTYYPKLALLQLHGRQGSFLVDPLSPGLDLAPLKSLMDNEHIMKVFHAASQDLEILYHVWRTLPNPFIDTQTMVMFLGLDDNMGYQALCEAFLGITISKAHQDINWLKRPLSSAQKLYAAQDVSYLYDIYALLKERLGEKYEWVREDMSSYRENLSFSPDPLRIWRRFSRPSGLKEDVSLRLMQLVLWRDEMARHQNLIARLILTDEECVEVVEALLAGHDPLSQGAMRHMKTLKNMMENPVPDSTRTLWESTRLRQRLPDKKRQDAVKAVCAQVAAQYNLSPSLIGRSKDIEAYILGQPTRLTEGWRHKLLGDLLS